MLPDRYYLTEVQAGPKHGLLYFYASTEGLNGPEYGYTEDDSWIDESYRVAIRGVKEGDPTNPWGRVAEPGVTTTVADPREISADELVRHDPWLNVYVVNAIGVAKQVVGIALHPIRVAWYWPSSNGMDDVAAYLSLSDDLGTFGEGLSLRQLRDESATRGRISKLYQDLLEFRSRTMILNLLRGKVGAGRD
jgi:hypothetical protein